MKKKYQYKTRVYYEDTDAGGIVYYANYLKFIERARTEMIYELLEMTHQRLKKDFNVGFVVKLCNIKYLKPAYFEDEITVFTETISKTPVRLKLLQEIRNFNELLVTASVELAVINTNGNIQKLPQKLFDKL